MKLEALSTQFVDTLGGKTLVPKTRYYDVMNRDRFKEVADNYPPKNNRLSSISSLAYDIRCHKSTLIRYYNEPGRELRSDIVVRVCVKTGVSMDWLFGLSDEKYLKTKGAKFDGK